MAVSVVIPVYNEVASLKELSEKICAQGSATGGQLQIIFVDDGSTDNSWETIQSIAAANPQTVTGIKLRRNFGKAAALSVGFREAIGEIIFTMDADLQDDPAEMPNFIKKIEEGYDLVSGWKKNRKDPLFDKTLPSRLFNAVTRMLTGVKLHDFNCGFKAYRKEVVGVIPLYGEMHRFIPVFANAEGFKVGEIPVEHHPRKFGKSKYGWYRSIKGCMDLLSVAAMTKFGRRPGHLFGGMGVIVGAVGFVTLLGLWINQLTKHYIGGRPLFFFGILCMLMGVQMICTGVLAELFLRQSGRHCEVPVAQKTGLEKKKNA
jgi:glycosyltransferase involved in cell wall biosynthesis